MTSLEKGRGIFTAKTPRSPRGNAFDGARKRPHQNPSPFGAMLASS